MSYTVGSAWMIRALRARPARTHVTTAYFPHPWTDGGMSGGPQGSPDCPSPPQALRPVTATA